MIVRRGVLAGSDHIGEPVEKSNWKTTAIISLLRLGEGNGSWLFVGVTSDRSAYDTSHYFLSFF